MSSQYTVWLGRTLLKAHDNPCKNRKTRYYFTPLFKIKTSTDAEVIWSCMTQVVCPSQGHSEPVCLVCWEEPRTDLEDETGHGVQSEHQQDAIFKIRYFEEILTKLHESTVEGGSSQYCHFIVRCIVYVHVFFPQPKPRKKRTQLLVMKHQKHPKSAMHTYLHPNQ